ncbi:Ada metal-binding domain-containing protein, partial [Streptomyces sp. NPDC047097]|uniref:bifunctional transcriptional activator/DNA repair enzyme AdaA n=1 Tax=Streptomyces sp. NPDC047097 TaxID=3155260 RepID=UPI0033CA908C
MPVRAYASDEERWRAVRERDAEADGAFYYVVRTTGTYSQPSCVVRLARRENVLFFATADEARSQGYRACRRCRPGEPGIQQRHATAVARACREMAEAVQAPNLDELARAAGYSRFHFHRMFRTLTGVTPHGYLAAVRARRVREALQCSATVAEAVYRAGFNSNGHFYAVSSAILGMTPQAFRAGGRGAVIRSATTTSSLGPVLVAAAGKGVCAVLLGDDRAALARRLAHLFPRARLVDGDASFTPLVTAA